MARKIQTKCFIRNKDSVPNTLLTCAGLSVRLYNATGHLPEELGIEAPKNSVIVQIHEENGDTFHIFEFSDVVEFENGMKINSPDRYLMSDYFCAGIDNGLFTKVTFLKNRTNTLKLQKTIGSSEFFVTALMSRVWPENVQKTA